MQLPNARRNECLAHEHICQVQRGLALPTQGNVQAVSLCDTILTSRDVFEH